MEQLIWAAWGEGGAFVYASLKLITAVWGENEVTDRARARAWAQFVVALIFGPLAAGAFTSEVLRHTDGKTTPIAVALTIGLCANAIWPVFVDASREGVKRLIGGWLKSLGAKMSGEDKTT